MIEALIEEDQAKREAWRQERDDAAAAAAAAAPAPAPQSSAPPAAAPANDSDDENKKPNPAKPTFQAIPVGAASDFAPAMSKNARKRKNKKEKEELEKTSVVETVAGKGLLSMLISGGGDVAPPAQSLPPPPGFTPGKNIAAKKSAVPRGYPVASSGSGNSLFSESDGWLGGGAAAAGGVLQEAAGGDSDSDSDGDDEYFQSSSGINVRL
jgi:hypothetical protein